MATDDSHHVVSPAVLIGVFAGLIGLTMLTVLLANFSLGAWETTVAMGIATVKAGLVAGWFMHLRYDRSLNSLILLTAVVCVGLFLLLTLADVDAYYPLIEQHRSE